HVYILESSRETQVGTAREREKMLRQVRRRMPGSRSQQLRSPRASDASHFDTWAFLLLELRREPEPGRTPDRKSRNLPPQPPEEVEGRVDLARLDRMAHAPAPHRPAREYRVPVEGE